MCEAGEIVLFGVRWILEATQPSDEMTAGVRKPQHGGAPPSGSVAGILPLHGVSKRTNYVHTYLRWVRPARPPLEADQANDAALDPEQTLEPYRAWSWFIGGRG